MSRAPAFHHRVFRPMHRRATRTAVPVKSAAAPDLSFSQSDPAFAAVPSTNPAVPPRTRALANRLIPKCIFITDSVNSANPCRINQETLLRRGGPTPPHPNRPGCYPQKRCLPPRRPSPRRLPPRSPSGAPTAPALSPTLWSAETAPLSFAASAAPLLSPRTNWPSADPHEQAHLCRPATPPRLETEAGVNSRSISGAPRPVPADPRRPSAARQRTLASLRLHALPRPGSGLRLRRSLPPLLPGAMAASLPSFTQGHGNPSCRRSCLYKCPL